MSSAAAFLALAVLGAGPSDGFVRPQPSTLSTIFGARWKIDVAKFEFLGSAPEEWARPYISEDGARAFAGARTGTLYGMDLITGERLFEKKAVGEIGYEMAEFRGLLLIGADQDLLGLDQQIGGERFRVEIGGRIGGPMTVTGTVALLPVRPNVLVAVDLVKREVLWRQKRPTPEGISVRGQAKPVVDAKKGRVYAGYSDGALLAISIASGDILWTATLGNAREFFADVDAEPVIVDGGKALVAASYNGGLFKLDAETGRQIWKRETLRIAGLARVGAGLLVATDGDGQVLGLYAASGKIRWRYKQKRGFATAPIPVGRQLVAVANSEGAVAFLDIETGRPKQLYAFGGGVSVAPFYRDPDIVVLSNQGAFVALRYGHGIGVTK